MRRAYTLWCTLVLLTIAFGTTSGCNPPTGQECEDGCGRLRDLAKESFDRRISTEDGLPEAMVRERWGHAGSVIDRLVESCTASCMELGKREVAVCFTKAENVAAWKGCLDELR